MNLGATEILIIAVVVLLLFGASKMPKMARSLGQSMRILKAETKGLRDDEEAAKETPVKSQTELPPAQPKTPMVAPPIEQTQANKNVS